MLVEATLTETGLVMPKVFLSVCFLVLICTMPVHAQGGDWVANEHFQSRLAAVPEGGNMLAVLEIELNEGWHTYGDPPGDSGLAPRFNWSKSSNLQDIKVTWPAPIRKREMDMFDVNAYEGQVRFPLTISPEAVGEDVLLDLDLQLMICKDICIPDQVKLSLLLKPDLREQRD